MIGKVQAVQIGMFVKNSSLKSGDLSFVLFNCLLVIKSDDKILRSSIDKDLQTSF